MTTVPACECAPGRPAAAGDQPAPPDARHSRRHHEGATAPPPPAPAPPLRVGPRLRARPLPRVRCSLPSPARPRRRRTGHYSADWRRRRHSVAGAQSLNRPTSCPGQAPPAPPVRQPGLIVAAGAARPSARERAVDDRRALIEAPPRPPAPPPLAGAGREPLSLPPVRVRFCSVKPPCSYIEEPSPSAATACRFSWGR